MTNPSERITKIANNLYNDNQEPLFYYTIDKIPSWIVSLAILSYLDEEQEQLNILLLSINKLEIIIGALAQHVSEELDKPKYACPNCHRITDKLLPRYETADSGRIGDMTLKVVTGCQHCLN